MPLRYTARILDHLSRGDGRRATVPELAQAFRVAGGDIDILRAAVDLLVGEGLVEAADGLYQLPAIGEEVIGIYRSTRRGFGFVTPKTRVREGDVYIPRGAAEGAISGDVVRCVVAKRHGWKEGSPAGRVAEVIERKQTVIVGTVIRRRRDWLIEPDGRVLRDPVLILSLIHI